jgi:hypothetical protein
VEGGGEAGVTLPSGQAGRTYLFGKVPPTDLSGGDAAAVSMACRGDVRGSSVPGDEFVIVGLVYGRWTDAKREATEPEQRGREREEGEAEFSRRRKGPEEKAAGWVPGSKGESEGQKEEERAERKQRGGCPWCLRIGRCSHRIGPFCSRRGSGHSGGRGGT